MNKPLLHILFFTILFLLKWQTVYCQNYFLSTNTLVTDNAVEATVRDFYRDSDGFMWMASSSGIARFDGHSFIQFNTTNSKLRSLLTSNGRKLVEDAEGYIWVVGDKTVDLLHHSTFEIIPFEEKFPNVPFEGHIRDFKQNDKKEIFFKSLETGKHYKYSVKIGFEELSFLPFQNELFINPNRGTGWMIERNHNEICKKYDLKIGEVLKSFRNKLRNFTHIENYTKKDLFWSRSNDTLTIFEAQKDGLEPIFVYKNKQIVEHAATSLHYLSPQDKFIIRLNVNEFFVLDLERKKMTLVPTPKIFEQGNFGRARVDNQGIIWTSNRKNIHLLKLNTNPFQQYPPFGTARGIWLNQDALFSAQSNTKVDLKTGDILKKIPLETINIAVETTIKDELWIGGVNGIFNVNPNTLELLDEFRVTTTERVVFWSILRDKNKSWWAGTRGRGLYYKGKNDDAFYPFTQYNNFEKALSCIHFLEDEENIWAASKNGLYLIHPQKGAIARYAQNGETGFQIPFDNIYFTHKKGDEYWVASSNSGIIRFTINEKYEITNLKHFTIEDGLPSNTVYAIIEDEAGRLWISTFKG